MSDTATGKAGASRSPSYPALTLEESIRLLRTFHTEQRRNAVPTDVGITTLGYSPTGSTGKRAIASLLAFNLLAKDGGKVRVSDLGHKLVWAQEGTDEWNSLLRQAALAPKIYAEIVKEYPHDLPSDAAITTFLGRDKGYHPDSIPTLIRDFRATYRYANLENAGTISDDNGAQTLAPESRETPPSRPGEPVTRERQTNAPQPGPFGEGSVFMPALREAYSLPIPLSRGRFAILQTPSDISTKEYERIRSYLDNNREAILEDIASSEEDSGINNNLHDD